MTVMSQIFGHLLALLGWKGWLHSGVPTDAKEMSQLSPGVVSTNLKGCVNQPQGLCQPTPGVMSTNPRVYVNQLQELYQPPPQVCQPTSLTLFNICLNITGTTHCTLMFSLSFSVNSLMKNYMLSESK